MTDLRDVSGVITGWWSVKQADRGPLGGKLGLSHVRSFALDEQAAAHELARSLRLVVGSFGHDVEAVVELNEVTSREGRTTTVVATYLDGELLHDGDVRARDQRIVAAVRAAAKAARAGAR